MVVKTFRGLLADGGQDRIRLSTIKGKVGYKIVKFLGISEDQGTAAREHIFKIYKTQQATIDGTINFTDSDLLGCLYVTNRNDTLESGHNVIIFDTEIFNQDIYITHFEAATSPGSGGSANYYLELEVIPLDDAGAEYTTLKDMRQS